MLLARTEEKRRLKEAKEREKQAMFALFEDERRRCPILLPLTPMAKDSLRRFPRFTGPPGKAVAAQRQRPRSSPGCRRAPRSAGSSRQLPSREEILNGFSTSVVW